MRLVDADVLEGLIDLALVDTIDEEHRYTKTAQNIVSGARLAKEAIKLAPTIEPSGDLTCETCVDRKSCIVADNGDWQICEWYKPSGDLISREDALRELNGACSNWQDDSKVADIISAMPSASDLISRADAIEAVHDACNYCDTCDIKGIGCSQINALSALPSAKAIDLNESCEKCEHRLKGANEVPCCYCTIGKSFYTPTVQGEWIENKDCEGKTRTITCSRCGYKERSWVNMNFCPNCGAKMTKGGDTE